MNLSLLSLFEQKKALLPEGTNAFRVLDGKGEGCPDLFIDALADKWLVSTRNRSIPVDLRHQLELTGQSVYHKHLEQENKEAPQHLYGPLCSERFEIVEQNVRFYLDFQTGYSQGLFLDQRNNRQRVRTLTQPGHNVLNTFSYTGGFSLYAALAGATTTTLDLAQPCLDWAKDNMDLNGLSPSDHFFCKGDTLHWLKRFAKQDRRFNGIILDPPTFSRDKNGKLWRVEKDFGHLVHLAYDCLAPGGWILCTTNCRKLSLSDFQKQIREALPPHAKLKSNPMPFDFTGEAYLKTVWCAL